MTPEDAAATKQDTPRKLRDAALAVLRDDGLAGLSARSVATRAGVNQALVFYHFGTLNGLVEAASNGAVDDSVEFYQAQFARVTTLADLLEIGRELHDRERSIGNVAVMAQLLAGTQQDDVLARAARYAMTTWIREIELVVNRVLSSSALAGLIDPNGVARAISAGFVGIELYEGIDPDGASVALDALEQFGALVQLVDDLGPVATRALRARMRRTTRRT